jgi:hypothetical protein
VNDPLGNPNVSARERMRPEPSLRYE